MRRLIEQVDGRREVEGEMRPKLRWTHVALAWLFVVGLVAQVFLAGRGVFDPAAGFQPHVGLGYTLELLPILLAILALVAGMGRRLVAFAVVEFGLFILQSVFVAMRSSNPSIAALHPVNGFLILLIALVIARESTAIAQGRSALS
jgi:hypothetical protein